jgi:hypothetical protein
MTDLIERLRDPRYCGQEGLRAEAADKIVALRERVAVLEAALRPLAEYRGSDEFLKSAEDWGLCAAVSFTAGQYRAARAALAKQEAGREG